MLGARFDCRQDEELHLAPYRGRRAVSILEVRVERSSASCELRRHPRREASSRVVKGGDSLPAGKPPRNAEKTIAQGKVPS
jgi:hypothetical protein